MRRKELTANVIIMGRPLLLMGLMFWSYFIISVISSAQLIFYYISIALFIVGFVMFFYAKWTVIKTGKLISFGSSQMTRLNRRLYNSGYVLMKLGAVITFILVCLSKYN